MKNYKSFSFIAAITTIAASVVNATGIVWLWSGIQNMSYLVSYWA